MKTKTQTIYAHEKRKKNYKKFTLCRFFYECENYARRENVESVLSSKRSENGLSIENHHTFSIGNLSLITSLIHTNVKFFHHQVSDVIIK